jgi:hypothetical protein
VDVGRVHARQSRTDRNRTQPEMEDVEAQLVSAIVLVVAHFEASRLEVDRHHLVVDPGVDAMVGPELLGRPGDQSIDGIDVASDEIGNATGRIARPRALLKSDDLEVGLLPSSLTSRCHPARIAAYDNQSLCH